MGATNLLAGDRTIMNLHRLIARLMPGSRHRSPAEQADPPYAIDMRGLRPPLPELSGVGRQAICDAICTLSLEGADPATIVHYAREDCERFIRTVDLVPEDAGRALEIGANPYFTTVMLRWFRPGLALSCTNFFVATEGGASQHVRVRAPNGEEQEHRFAYTNVNVEAAPPACFPYEDTSFDGVLFCEVIEHLQMNPLRTLREIWRVLKPGGWLILTTPNVARLVNAVRMIDGNNLYDPYSGHGPYGRHNREYSCSELRALGSFAGFELETMFTSDVYDDSVEDLRISPELSALLRHREQELGQYIFSRWRKGLTPPRPGKPSWLYNSYPAGEMVEVPYPYR